MARVTAVQAITLLAACAGRPEAGAQAGPRSATEAETRREVLAVTDRMLDAMWDRDTAALAALFEPGARLVGMRTRKGATEAHVQVLTPAQFGAFLARDTRGPWHERLWDAEVRVDGTLATVWAAYDFHFGDEFSHCGTDAFQLLRTGAGWRIVSLADTYRTEGCTRRPPPSRQARGR